MGRWWYRRGNGVRAIFGLSVFLPVASIGVLFGFWSELFGPPGLMVLGNAGLMISAACVCLAIQPQIRDWFQRVLPNGLAARWPGLGSLRQPLQVAICLVGAIAFASVVTTLLSSGLDGVSSGPRPVFRQRDRYTLNNHGRITVVPRSRYLLVGASGCTGWHTGILYFMLWAEHFLLFGKPFYPRGVCLRKKSPPGEVGVPRAFCGGREADRGTIGPAPPRGEGTGTRGKREGSKGCVRIAR